MGIRTPNPQRVKIHRSYAVDEIARLLHVHKNTVRAWLKAGLRPNDEQRPILVHGEELRAFLEKRRQGSKCKCPPGHLYCLRCRAPRAPAGAMADYVAITATTGNLIAVCPTCTGIMCRRIAWAKVEAMRAFLDIAVPQAERHIRERAKPSLNCDIKTEPLEA